MRGGGYFFLRSFGLLPSSLRGCTTVKNRRSYCVCYGVTEFNLPFKRRFFLPRFLDRRCRLPSFSREKGSPEIYGISASPLSAGIRLTISRV